MDLNLNKKDLKKISKMIHEFDLDIQKMKDEKVLKKQKDLEKKQLERRCIQFSKELEDPENFINFLSDSYEFNNIYSLDPEEIVDVNFKLIEFRSKMRDLVISEFKKFTIVNDIPETLIK